MIVRILIGVLTMAATLATATAASAHGDVVIVPPGMVHGWDDIPDHVDYLSFRPSQSVLQPGWVNPTIAK